MKFLVSYLFVTDEEEGVQVDIVDYKDKKSCEKAYSSEEYKILEIQEYDENAMLEDMYSEEDDDINDDEEDEEDEEHEDDGDLSIVFPNADTEEELEEELEHSLTRMMDN